MKRILQQLKFPVIFLLCIDSSQLIAQKWDTLAPIPESFTFPVVAVVDGKIHIMGGGGSGGATDHHFAYDPTTNTWESLAPVPYKAQQPAGAAANGKIHFFGGGFPTSGNPLDSHYVYDPATDSWAQAAKLTVKRAIHYGISLNDVLYTLAGQGVANLCQTYDSLNDAWVTKTNLPDNGFWYGAHVATEGHIYRFCGGGYTAPNNLAHRYDPDTDTWTSLPEFPAATHGISGAAIGSKIFLVGGYHDFLDRDEVWVFDTETNQYTPGIPLPIGRTYHNTVAINDCIYVLGGNNAIDASVTFQLLRLCPFESTAVSDVHVASGLKTHYASGTLSIQKPRVIQGPVQLMIFNLQGRMVFFDHMIPVMDDTYEAHLEELNPAIYVIRLQTINGVYIDKFVVAK